MPIQGVRFRRAAVDTRVYPLIGKGVSLCLACSVAGYRFPADSSFKNSFVMVVLSPLMYPRIPVGGLLLD